MTFYERLLELQRLTDEGRTTPEKLLQLQDELFKSYFIRLLNSAVVATQGTMADVKKLGASPETLANCTLRCEVGCERLDRPFSVKWSLDAVGADGTSLGASGSELLDVVLGFGNAVVAWQVARAQEQFEGSGPIDPELN